ncbi:MAG: LamG-like jellyroll fold domain-containing protein, partial [Actinomycetota bacterium]
MHRSLRLVRSLFATALVAGLVVPAAVDTPSAGAQGRAIDGLLALYDFDDGAGATVSDVAGADNPVDLTIADPGSVTWTDGGLRIDSPTVVASSGSTGSIASPIVSNRSFTVEVWVDRSDVPQSNGARIVDLSHSFSDVGIALVQRPYSSAPDRVELRTRTTDSNRRGLSGVRAPRRSFPADLVHLVATHAPDGSVRIYQDGVEVATDDSGVLSGWRLPTTLRLGASTDGRAPWLGEYRLLALYDRALSPAEVAGNFGAGPDLADVEPPNVTEPPADPPAITDGPEDVVLTEGDTANFVITATGTPPLTYQWFRDDT